MATPSETIDKDDSTTKGTSLSACDSLRRSSNTNDRRDLDAPSVVVESTRQGRYNCRKVDSCCCGCVKELYFDESDIWEWDYFICRVMTRPSQPCCFFLFALLPALAILGLVLIWVGVAIHVMGLWVPWVALLVVPGM